MDGLLSTARVLVSLAVVFGLLWYLARRMRSGRGRGRRRTAAVQVLGRAGLGGKASVVVVEAEGRRLVLGVTEHGVAVLHEAEAAVESTAGAQAGEGDESGTDAAAAAIRPAIPFPAVLAARTQWAPLGSARRSAAHAAELAPRGLRGQRGEGLLRGLLPR